MSFATRLRYSLAVGVVAVFGGVAFAGGAGVKQDLEHYFPIRAALAADTIEGVKEHAQPLAGSTDKQVAKAAEALAETTDVTAARKAFGDLSKALIAGVEKAAKGGADVGTVYVFECPMAKPFGRWMQAEESIGNPYKGSSMLRCGKKIATFGEAEQEGARGGHAGGHGGHHH